MLEKAGSFTWCAVSLILLHIVGGGIFSWLERDSELARYEKNREFYDHMKELYEFKNCKEEFFKEMKFCKRQHEFNGELKRLLELSGREMQDHRKWTFFGASFFVSTLVSTLGYGDLHPETPVGKVFAVVFGLLGMPVMGYVVSRTGGFLIDKMPMWCFEGKRRQVFVLISLMVVFILVGGLTFTALEGWTFIEACYFSTCTMMMIGFGDFLPTYALSRIVTMGFIVLGLGVGASFAAVLQVHLDVRGEAFASHLNSWYQSVKSECSHGGLQD